MKALKIISIIIAALILVYVSLSLLAANYLDNKIKQLAIQEINKKIETKIDVEDIEFSVIRSFPYAELVFSNAVIFSSPGFNKNEFRNFDCDTLLKAKSISLSFNINSIFRNKLNLRKIDIENGKINLLVDSQGKGNYEFWKKNDSETEGQLNIDLNNVQFSDIEFLMVQRGQQLVFHNQFHSLNLSGEFSGSNFNLDINSQMWVGKFLVAENSYLSRRSANLQLNLDVNNNVFSIKKGNLKFGELIFNLAGQINLDSPNSIDLKINGNNLDIQKTMSLFPPLISKYVKGIESKGIFYFDTHIFGKFSNKKAPQIETDFGIKNGTFIKSAHNLTIKNINIDGSFSNGANPKLLASKLNIKSFNFDFDKGGSFSGNFLLSNFNNPYIEINSDFNTEISEISEFFEIDNLESVSGKISGKIAVKGKLPKGFQDSPQKLKNLYLSGKISTSDINILSKNKDINIENLSGVVNISNATANFKTENFRFNNTDVNISLQLAKPLETILISKQSLKINGNINSPKIDLKNFIRSNSSAKSKIDLLENLNANITLSTDTFIYNRFVARNFSSKLIFEKNKIKIDKIDISTLNGKLLGNIVVEENKYLGLRIAGNVKMFEIDIHELLFAFENFGQDFIKSKHVIGDISGNVYFSSDFNNNMNIIDDDLLVESSIEIKNGELFDFEPMMKLSDFIMIEDLKHIKFSTLKNDIVIQNSKIFIPNMTINSSAIDIDISGIHNFNQDISYDIKLLLSSLFSRKIKQKRKKEWNIADNDDDKITLFLILEGNVDDLKIRYDFKRAKSVLKENIKEEKQEIKQVLKQELGLFKKDTTVKIKPKPKNKKVQIVWDEDDDDKDVE